MNYTIMEQLMRSVYWECEQEIENNDYVFNNDVEKYLSEVLHRGIFSTSSSNCEVN